MGIFHKKIKNHLLILFLIIVSISSLIYYKYFSHWRADKIVIENFNNEVNSVLKPNKSRKFDYNVHSIWITGFVNDTVFIYNNIGSCYLVDSISYNFFYDYYVGDQDAFMRFEPYKATNGKLEIKHTIR